MGDAILAMYVIQIETSPDHELKLIGVDTRVGKLLKDL